MSGHYTPGPWHRNIPPATKYVTVWAGRNTHVARVVPDHLPAEQVEGNIALIASAPTLLDALLDIKRLAESGNDRGYEPFTLLEMIATAAREAIATAGVAASGDDQRGEVAA